MKKVMILYETVGGGHLANARALQAAIAERHPEIDVFMTHIGEEARSQRLKALYGVYNTMLKTDPLMVRVGYRIVETLNPETVLFSFVHKARQNLARCILREKPDLIVSAFSVINHVALRVLQDIGWFGRVPYYIFCTDLSHGFLRNWVAREATGMIALSEGAARQMVEFGFDRQRITILQGLPVHPDFIRVAPGRESARKHLRLQPDKFTVLITMGGVAGKGALRAARELGRSGLPLQLIVVCGRNRLLERRVRRLAARSPLSIRVLGFTDQMPLLMEACDVVVTKPGPGTIAEAVAKARPLLIDGTRVPMPQEVGNLGFVSRNGIGQIYDRMADLPRLVGRFLEDQDHYTAATHAMQRLRKPESVFDLADYIASKVPDHARKPPLAGVS